ncbi:MAG: hypothetical protein D6705_16860 [Deltaproteobacteria bacterium]|nr:MAG: hypothetical protein D6705_16860 [Deltaproteobacteria bacterium]
MAVVLDDLNLHKAERLLCERALAEAGTIVEAAKLLGITRHALKRRIVKHGIEWPPRRDRGASDGDTPRESAPHLRPVVSGARA